MTAKPTRDLGVIGTAAHALETDLGQFELAAATATRLPLTSRRNLDKATNAINEAADCQRRVGEHIQVLMTALNEARDKNQLTAEALRIRSVEIQAKSDEHRALLARFEDLGKIAKTISVRRKNGVHLRQGPEYLGSRKSLLGSFATGEPIP